MSEESNKVEVRVGAFAQDGTFLGELVRFTGEEVGSYTDYSEAQSKDDRGTTYTLYRCPRPGGETGYRVHVERWSRWQGEGSEAYLWPQDEDGSFYVATEAGAREYHSYLFAALGMPNVRDID